MFAGFHARGRAAHNPPDSHQFTPKLARKCKSLRTFTRSFPRQQSHQIIHRHKHNLPARIRRPTTLRHHHTRNSTRQIQSLDFHFREPCPNEETPAIILRLNSNRQTIERLHIPNIPTIKSPIPRHPINKPRHMNPQIIRHRTLKPRTRSLRTRPRPNHKNPLHKPCTPISRPHTRAPKRWTPPVS